MHWMILMPQVGEPAPEENSVIPETDLSIQNHAFFWGKGQRIFP